MRTIGFSTGALAYSDFRLGLQMARTQECQAIELSALRESELFPLLAGIATLDLTGFSYISIHAPSQFGASWEPVLANALENEVSRNWPIVIHPDALSEFELWKNFGPRLCVENMDKRKPIGRTARELDQIFKHLPDASLCFDIGHARQCDPTMTEAYLILKEFGPRLRQVHVSEVNTASKHDPLSYAAILAFQDIAHLISDDVPLILETPVQVEGMAYEMEKAREALPTRGVMTV